MAPARQFEILAAGITHNAALVSVPYVKFFAAGTSIGKDAWDDRDKSVAIRKKSLDSQGRGTVYGDGVYRLVFYAGDPDDVNFPGVKLFERDNYFVGLDPVPSGGSGITRIETFAAAQELSGLVDGDTVHVLSRGTPLYGLVDPFGGGGIFGYSSGNYSAAVASDSLCGIYLPLNSDPTGASGALVRKFDGAMRLEWFGGKGDWNGSTGTDNYAAIMGALGVIQAGTGYYVSSPAIYLPTSGQDQYYCSQTVNIKKSVRIYGDGSGLPSSSEAALIFPADTTGIIVHRYNTIDDTTEVTPTTAGDSTTISGVRIASLGGTDKTKHGIWLRARANLEKLRIDGFSGNAINIVASAGGAVEGNANNWQINIARIQNCEHGLYVDGADVNAGVAIGLDASSNRRWGIWDSSFLGNTYIGAHAASNGKVSQVYHLGNRYYLLDETADIGGATEPGTDPSVWVSLGAGSVHPAFPQWVSANYYAVGGSYKTDNSNARNVFIGCYTESGQPPAKMVLPTTVYGGLNEDFTPDSTAFRVGAGTSTGLLTRFSIASANVTTSMHRVADESLTMEIPGDGAGGWAVGTDGTEIIFRHRRVGARTPIELTTDLSTLTGGRASPIGGGKLVFPQGIWVGGGTSGMRFQDTGTAPPATGEYGKGDIRWNTNPAAGGNVGWSCITSGSPGTWKAFGAIDL